MASHARTRSLSGCTTCRIRHLKCDETRPTRQTCAQHGVECKGYENRIHFLLDVQHTPTDEDATKLRRPLYTEAQRHVMSEELVASTGFKTPSQILAEIDSESALFDPNHSSTKQTGPFGVFSALPLVAASCTYIGLPTETAQLSNDEREPLSWSPLSIFANDFCGTGPRPCGLSEDALNALGLLNNTLQDDVPFVRIDLDLEDYMATFSTPCQLPARLSFSSGSDFPGDAPSLFSHYKTAIIPLLSPLRYNKKSPWETLHLRCAMQTLAQLTMKLTPNNAQSAVFYALLSTSAFHLSAVQGASASSHWTEMGEQYLTKPMVI
ncbi:hypothetical protein M8818_003268 [Zalaria obscura]|uniref:Uncharacterized protein n=1 Tax=Zalaria obscura TaxID=2024903 RepID=A0ACC3SF44_9PEZI